MENRDNELNQILIKLAVIDEKLNNIHAKVNAVDELEDRVDKIEKLQAYVKGMAVVSISGLSIVCGAVFSFINKLVG